MIVQIIKYYVRTNGAIIEYKIARYTRVLREHGIKLIMRIIFFSNIRALVIQLIFKLNLNYMRYVRRN